MNNESLENLINDYSKRIIPVKEILSKYSISSRKLYKILIENGIEIKKRKPKERRPPKHNLIGKKFHHLTVEDMKFTEKSKVDKSYRCICRCDCGNMADCSTNYLMRGLIKTCGQKECLYHRQDYTNNGKNNIRFNGYEEILGSKWSSYKCGAKRRNLDFNVDIKSAWELFLKQERRCFFTGLEITFGKTNTDFKNSTASLDRLDSKKGYTIDNVVWVHKKINTMKMDLELSEFIFLCKKVYENQKDYEN
jgi:hypothetical protein